MYMNIGPDAECICSARALARGNRSAEIIGPDAERLCSRLLARPLKYHALKRCTFGCETCLASAIALWLVNQRARAANRLLRLVPSQLKAGEQKQKVCLSIQTSFTLVFMEQNHSLGHLTSICSVCTFGASLKVPRAKALHFLA